MHTVETKVSEWHVDTQILIATCILDLLGKIREQLVQLCAASAFFLFSLEFVFIAHAVLALAVARLVELHVCGFAIELDILRLSLANHNWIDKVDMDNDDEFLLRRLEEKMSYIVEQNIDRLLVHPVNVPNTVLVDFDMTGNSLSVKSRPNEEHVELLRSTIYSR
jgi:hypothetical protein